MISKKRPAAIFACFLFLVSLATDSDGQEINFSGTLGLILEDTGGGIYSGVPQGTLFTGSVDPRTGDVEISDGSKATQISCCIFAEALSVSNDEMLDDETATLLNMLVGDSIFSAGQLIDGIDIEGDANTLGNGRIEVGLSFLFPGDTFNDESPENYPFDPNDLLLSLFFIVEEDNVGEDVYSAVGLLIDTPPARQTRNADGSETTAVISGGVKLSGSNSFANTFNAGEAIQIIADIVPEPEEVGEQAEIFVVANDGANWILITQSGLVPFDGTVDGLIAFDDLVLEASNSIDILGPFGGEFTLTVAEVGNYLFFVAYTTGDGVVTYNSEPIELSVTQ